MPTLSETLRQRQNSNKQLVRGQGGVLSEETPDEIQTLADKAGIAPPTTPVGAAAIGATPKQQDMMGSPAQKTAALNLSQQDPEATIAGALRRREVRQQATAEEAGKIEKSENLKNLGGLGDRVNDFINAQRTKLEQTNAQQQVADTGSNASGQQQNLSSIKPLLQQLAANPSDMNLQLQVNQALGYDANRQLSPDEINNLYKGSVDSITASGADAVDNQLTASDLIAQGNFGYDQQQLADLLGVPVDQVGNMSVGQIRNQVNQLMSNEFSSVSGLEQQAGSLNAGAAERALARGAAREASRVGIRSTEADVANLEQQIQNADQVSFGGQVMNVDQLLSDDTISKTISDYLNAAPGSPQRTQLEQSEPQLISFITKNQALLQDAAEQLSQGAGQFQNLQQTNKDIATLGGMLSPELAQDLVPGYDQLSAGQLDPNSVPVLAATQGMNAGQRASFGANLKSLASQFPGMATELAGLSQDEIKSLGFDDPNGKWKQFEEQQQRYQQIMNTPDEDINTLIGQIYDIGPNDDVVGDLSRATSLSALGIAPRGEHFSVLDSDNDGKPDSASDIKARFITGQPSLKGALNGEKSVMDPTRYRQPGFPPEKMENAEYLTRKGDETQLKTQAQALVFEKLGKQAADGLLSSDDIRNAYPDNPDGHHLDFDQTAQELKYLLGNASLDNKSKKTLSTLLNRNVRALTDKVIEGNSRIFDSSMKNPNAKDLPTIQQAIDDMRKLKKSYVNMDQGRIDAHMKKLLSLQESINRDVEKAKVKAPKGSGRIDHLSDEERKADYQRQYDKASDKQKKIMDQQNKQTRRGG